MSWINLQTSRLINKDTASSLSILYLVNTPSFQQQMDMLGISEKSDSSPHKLCCTGSDISRSVSLPYHKPLYRCHYKYKDIKICKITKYSVNDKF